MKRIVLMLPLLAGVAGVSSADEFTFGRPIKAVLARNLTSGVAIGDANGDGRMDLAVTENSDESSALALYLQQSDGTLAPGISIALPVKSSSLPVSFIDLDHDGPQEMIVGHGYDQLLVLRYSNGALASTSQALPAGCAYIATGDIDGDGNVDVVCHDIQVSASILFGDGSGGFRSKTLWQTPAGTWASDLKSVRLADVTGDGRTDLLLTSSVVNGFFVFQNNGLGGFWQGAWAYPHPWSPSGVWPAALDVLDVDGDGVDEVVTASPDNQPDARLNVYRRNARGFLTLAQRLPIHDSTTALLTADLDRDGDKELLGAHLDFHAVTVMGANGAELAAQARYELPGFTTLPWWHPSQFGTAKGLAVGDLNGDGCSDLAAATKAGITLLYGCRPYTSSLPVSDFDGDGVSDLFWRYEAASHSEFWMWAENSYPCTYHNDCVPLFVPSWQAQSFGDFDGDGNSDVFWRDRKTGENAVAFAAAFRRALPTVASQTWQVVGAGDFDGDDRSDLLWRNFATGANAIWRSADLATPMSVNTVADLAWKIQAVGDFNGDGKSDVFWRNVKTGANVYWKSANATTQQGVTGVSNLDWKVVGVGDFNGDRRDDIVWRNGRTGANAIWLSANGSTQKAVSTVTNLDWQVGAVGDYDGDGFSDLMWRNLRTGANVIWRSGNGAATQAVDSSDPVMQLMPVQR